MPGLLSKEQEAQEEGISGIPTEADAMGGGGDSLNDRIEGHIREQLGEENLAAFDQVLEQGMKLLFSKETNAKLFDSIRPEDEIPIADELGTAATNLMLAMYEKSGNSIPGEVIIPAGTVLLARAVDFINESEIAQVSDEDFGEALQIFVDVLQAKLGGMTEEGGMPQETEQPQPTLPGGV